MKQLIIGDLHCKEKLGYADHIEDGREAEKKGILDFIIEQSKDCDGVVMLGDQFHYKNNQSKVVKEFIEFIERLGDKKITLLNGNHEKFSDGRSAMDFMKEIRGKNWNVVDKLTVEDNFTFCPYHFKSELEANTVEEATDKLTKELLKEKTDILFVHHALSTMRINKTLLTSDMLNEIVLPVDKLGKNYKLIVGGHIHSPQTDGNVICAGSVFNNEVGETQKYIYKIDDKLGVEQIKLPGRGVYKLENPTLADLKNITKSNIVKVILTKKQKVEDVIALKKELKKYDAHIFIEQYPRKRRKLHISEGESMLEFDVEKLLDVYAKNKEVDPKKLHKGFQLINN